MNINFAFLRHGYGCHNAMSNLVSSQVITYKQAKEFLSTEKNVNVQPEKNIFSKDILPLNDPVLTHVGVDASIYNGCIINKILKRLPEIYNDPRLNMETFNVVGCSPLIRCMETAYYMTRKWKNPPNKIYVFPLLREIDESSVDKYSEESKEIIRITPSYSIKSIQEQKDYLQSLGILKYFDFSFVEAFPSERIEPGDIKEFIVWFGKYFVNLLDKKQTQLNVLITTHAGVLRDYANEGFYNNSGFVTSMTYNGRFSLNRYVSLNDFIKEYNFFLDYKNPKYSSKEYYCPSDRCGQLCSVASGRTGKEVQKVNLVCNLEESNTTQASTQKSSTQETSQNGKIIRNVVIKDGKKRIEFYKKK
jgi:broad specificity phosphatase PhoE